MKERPNLQRHREDPLVLYELSPTDFVSKYVSRLKPFSLIKLKPLAKDQRQFILKNLCSSVFICGLIFFFSINSFAQKVAVLAAEKTKQSEAFAETFSKSLDKNFKVIDLSLAKSILSIKDLKTPFNLTTEDAKNLGVSIGCNFFILIKTDTWRRSDIGRDEYYEAFAAFYLVSTKTGRLVYWKLKKIEKDTSEQAKSELFASTEKFANEITKQIKLSTAKELNEEKIEIAELPNADSPEAKGFRPPLPYRRLKPKYTTLASLYDVTATVDALVDIDKDGKVLRIEIIRWAGFGLDKSVAEIINKMNWRPADRNGKTMPMRILLRYNFRNIETE